MANYENYINYSVVEESVNIYNAQAQNLMEIMSTLDKTNDRLITEGWRNDTSVAFKEKYDTVHKRAMQDLIAAIEELSRYLTTYAQDRQAEDSSSAALIR